MNKMIHEITYYSAAPIDTEAPDVVVGQVLFLFGRVYIVRRDAEAHAQSTAEALGGIYRTLVSNIMVEVIPESLVKL